MQAILFDLDGTLVDSAPDVHFSINLALQKMKLPTLTYQQALKAIGPGAERFVHTILGEANAPRLDEFISIFRPIYSDHCANDTRPFPGIVELLNSLQGYRLAVVTNKRLEQTQHLLNALDLTKYFEILVGPELVTRIKPAPDMINYVLERFALAPGQAIMVGDTDNDLLAAKAAHVPVCAVAWGYADIELIKSLQPEYLIDRPDQLLQIVAGLSLKRASNAL